MPRAMTKQYYPLQSSDDERQRLIAQGELVAPLTRRLFDKAGIASGMRVLDIGSGSGDVALLAARMVGPQGSVLGIDRDPAQVAFAAQRAQAKRFDNVRFMAADFRDFERDQPVDAIVGRLVLMYAADPVDALRRAAPCRNRSSTTMVPFSSSRPIVLPARRPRGSGPDSGTPACSRAWGCGCSA
jgi:protein-L-isoaspartate O-methyltransferase